MGQDSARQDNVRQHQLMRQCIIPDKTRQDTTMQSNRRPQDKTIQENTRQDKTITYNIVYDKTRYDTTRQVQSYILQDKTRQDNTK